MVQRSILENQHVKQSYMGFYFKGYHYRLTFTYITMLLSKRGIENEKKKKEYQC